MKCNPFLPRLFLAALLLSGVSPAAWARGGELLKSSFFSVGFGVNTYHNGAVGLFANADMQVTVAAGRWISYAGGFRLDFTELHAANGAGVASFYESTSFTAFVDPVRLLRPQRAVRPWNMKLLLGCGAIHRRTNAEQLGDNDFMGVMGASVEYHLYEGLYLNGEVRLRVYPSGYDGNPGIGRMLMAMAGIIYMPTYMPYFYVSRGESQRLCEDWYVGGALSGGMWVTGAMPTAGADVVVGKHFSTVCEMRGRLTIGAAGGEVDFSHGIAAVDVMININSLFDDQRNRPWSISPYAGAGIIDNFSDRSRFLFGANGGLYIRRWVSPHGDLYLDLRGLVVSPRFSSLSGSLAGTVSVGYVYNIGRNTCR